MATYYIDPTLGTNASGSFASPYNTMPITADNTTYLFKEGTTWGARTSTYAPSRPGLVFGVYDATTGARVTDGSKWFTWDFRNKLLASSHAFALGSLCSTGLDIQGMIIKAGWFVNHNGVTYQCILANTSSASTEPGVGASWATYWYAHRTYLTDSPQWVTGTAYQANNGACIDFAQTSTSAVLKHIRTVGCAAGLSMTAANIATPTLADIQCTMCYGSVAMPIGGTSGGNMVNPTIDGIGATDCKGLGVGYRRISGTSTLIKNTSASFNGTGGVAFMFVSGLSVTSVDGIVSTDNTGDNVIIDSGCNALILNNVTGDRGSDNGFSGLNISSPGNPPVNCEVRRYRFLNCGDIAKYADVPASDGDGFSCHAGTGWVFDTGISCGNLNSGCCHVGSSTGTIRNSVLVGNGYQQDGTPSPVEYQRGGLSLLNSGRWVAENCIIEGNLPFDIQLSSANLLDADTNLLGDSNYTVATSTPIALAAFIAAVEAGTGGCTNVVTGDHLLDPADNFAPLTGSAAIGTGKGVGIGNAGIDYEGNQRPAPSGDYTIGHREDYPPPKEGFGPWVHFDGTIPSWEE